MRDGRAEGSPAVGDVGRAAGSLTPDVDGILRFLAGLILSTLLKKRKIQ